MNNLGSEVTIKVKVSFLYRIVKQNLFSHLEIFLNLYH